jgi:hypothetical protein
MVINNLNVFWAIISPLETDSPLFIDADTVPVSNNDLVCLHRKLLVME